MKTYQSTLRERINLGTKFMRAHPLTTLFVPYVPATACIGCWSSTDPRDSISLGSVTMSAMITSLLGYAGYISLGFLLLRLFSQS